MENSPKNKILIIGGGYGGLKALNELAKDPTNEIILLDKNAYHYMQTDVYDLIANEYDFAKVSVDLFTYCLGFDTNVSFYKQEVLSIDFANKKLITERQRFSYDYLIIGVGARTKFFSNIPGLREFAYGIKALERAIYFKQKFELSLFQKIDQEGLQCTPLNIVIAGAGLSGVEIAAQMASFAKDFYEHNYFLCRKLNIVLVSATDHILKGMDEKLVKSSERHLKKLGVVIKNNVKVTSLTKTQVNLSNGEVLEMDFMIFTGGIEPNALVQNLEHPKNEAGYLKTNQFLQSVEHEEVFAVGDCTTIYDRDNNFLAPTADIAEQMGIYAAKNIMKKINSQEMEPHHIKSRGILIALGRRYASGKIFDFYIHGYLAYLFKKMVERMYQFDLTRRSHRGCKKIFCD